MGKIIKLRDLPAAERNGIQRPIIYCNPEAEMDRCAISVNVALAKKLLGTKPNRRTMRLEQCFAEVVNPLPDDSVVKDFDVMFNPDYEVNILHILISLAKNKKYRVIWPGKCDGKRLIYAEEGYRDYKVYEIEQYDVTCVV